MEGMRAFGRCVRCQVTPFLPSIRQFPPLHQGSRLFSSVPPTAPNSGGHVPPLPGGAPPLPGPPPPRSFLQQLREELTPLPDLPGVVQTTLIDLKGWQALSSKEVEVAFKLGRLRERRQVSHTVSPRGRDRRTASLQAGAATCYI